MGPSYVGSSSGHWSDWSSDSWSGWSSDSPSSHYWDSYWSDYEWGPSSSSWSSSSYFWRKALKRPKALRKLQRHPKSRKQARYFYGAEMTGLGSVKDLRAQESRINFRHLFISLNQLSVEDMMCMSVEMMAPDECSCDDNYFKFEDKGSVNIIFRNF